MERCIEQRWKRLQECSAPLGVARASGDKRRLSSDRTTRTAMRLPAVPGLLGCVPASGFVVPADVPMPSARFVYTGTTAGLTRAQQPRSATTAMALLMAAAGDGDNKRPWESFATAVAKKAVVAAAVAAAVAFSAPGDALAADSGGRISGGSFSDSSYTSSYSTGSSSRQYQDLEEGGGISDGTDLVLFCGTVGAAYGLDRGVEELEKRVITRFGNLDDCPRSSRGEGVDVIKLQFAINCCDRGSNSILGVLEDVSARADTGSRLGLAEVVSEISFALGRGSSDWVASASELEHFDDPNTERAEAIFSQYSVQLRAKIKRETNAVVRGKNISVQRSGQGSSASPGRPTVAVVCLVMALRGDALQRLGLDKNVNSSVSGLKSALQAISSESLSDAGHNLLAAEVLWTPEEPWEVLSKEDAMEDFPDLLDLAPTC